MAQKIINTKIQEAYDTEANWIKYNPVLLAGQLAFSKDKYGKYKIGDGIAKWSQLQYMTLGWNDITGKPSSFTPSSHTHDDRYFTETEATNKFSPKEGSASLSKLASTITLGAGDAATILQNGSTYQQKIEIIDNSTSGDAVFGFYQSGDSGKNFNKLMTINDDGNVVANKFTGALAGNASSASSVPWSGVSGKPSTFPPSTHNHPASQITGLPTKLPNPYVLTVKANGYLLNTYDGTAAKEVNITPAVIGAATSGHTHSQYAPTSHNHSADNITSGVLPIGRGGTGGTNLTTTASNLQFESIGEGATTIPNNSDLNTYSTPGTYVSQSAKNTGIKNRPTGTQGAFKLVVKYALGNILYIQQVMTGYDAGTHMEYTRYYDGYGSNKTWSRWVKTFADNSVIPVTSGGTGANTYSTALKNLVINGAVSGSAVPTDTNWYLCSDIADSSGTPVRRSMSSLWSYIKGKTDANYLKLSGTAVSASSIKVPDTRDTNPAPNNAGFKKNAVTFDFKYASKINSPISNTYVGLMSFAPWSETSGGNGYQMAFGYSNATTPRLSIRTADLSATTWGAWYKVYTSADKPTLSELGAAASSHTHNYAGSSSAGGAANSANMLNANAGSSTQPVYFAGGKPVACAYTLGKSVPSNAVFTDTWRPVQNNLTSTSTSDALSAYQGKVLKDLIDGKASSNHSHDTGICTIQEKSNAGTRYVKIAELVCNRTYHRLNQQLIFASRERAVLLNVRAISGNNTIFTASIDYVPISENSHNIINNLYAGLVNISSTQNRIEIWYKQVQWAESLRIIPLGRNAESNALTFKNYSSTDAGSTSAPTFTKTIPINSVIRWENVVGRPSSMPASDVYSWAKASTKPAYSKTEIGLGNVDNTADSNKSVKYATSAGNAKTATNVAWSGITGKPSSFTPSSHSHTIANITNLQSALDGKANYTHNHDAAYATRTHAHEHIRDCNNKADIGISSTLGIVPSVSEKYDIVVTNTSEFGNKFVTMDKDIFIGKIPLKAITNSQIDSLASL